MAVTRTFINPETGLPDYVQTDETPQKQIPPDMPPISIPADEAPLPPIVEPYQELPETPASDDGREQLQACRDCNDSVSELLDAITSSIKAGVAQAVNDASAPIVDCESKACGQIGRRLDAIEQQLAKLLGKIAKPINSGLNECYSYIAGCGLSYDTIDRVCNGLLSGNVPSDNTDTYVSTPVPSSNQAPSLDTDSRPIELIEPKTVTPAHPTPVPAYQPPTLPQFGQPNPVTSGYFSSLVMQIVDLAKTWPSNPDDPSSSNEPPEQQFYSIFLPQLIQQLGPPKDPYCGVPLTAKPFPTPDQGVAEAGPSVFTPPDWGKLQACTAIRSADHGGIDPVTGTVLGFGDIDGKLYAPLWFREWIPGGDYGNWKYRLPFRVMYWIDKAITTACKSISVIMRCEVSRFAVPLAYRTLLGVLDYFTNGSISPLLKSYDYWIAWVCPQSLPDQSQVNHAYLANEIDVDIWECWTRANNNHLDPMRRIIRSDRTKPSAEEYIKLWRWGKIGDADFKEAMRGLGYTEAADRLAKEKSSEVLPSISDIMRMMVRDVADDEIVNKYNLDDNFGKKYDKQLFEWAFAQGYETDIAKAYWRSHWQYPSDTQAFAMYHRLRPDSDLAKRLDAESRARVVNGKPGPGVITSFDDVKQLLEVNDLAWYWRDRLAAIAYHPLTRTDAQRAYALGSLGKDEAESDRVLKGVYQDEGYAPETADILVKFTKQLTAERNARKIGNRSYQKWIRWYLDSTISYSELEEKLNVMVYDKNKRAALLADAKEEKTIVIRRAKIACIRNDYMAGELSEVEVKTRLLEVPIPLEQAIELVESIWCRRKKKDRMVTATKLCEWYEMKLISKDDYVRRLVKIGFSVEDSALIIAECSKDISERQMKRTMADLRRTEAAAKREQAITERLARSEKRKNERNRQIPPDAEQTS